MCCALPDSQAAAPRAAHSVPVRLPLLCRRLHATMRVLTFREMPADFHTDHVLPGCQCLKSIQSHQACALAASVADATLIARRVQLIGTSCAQPTVSPVNSTCAPLAYAWLSMPRTNSAGPHADLSFRTESFAAIRQQLVSSTAMTPPSCRLTRTPSPSTIISPGRSSSDTSSAQVFGASHPHAAHSAHTHGTHGAHAHGGHPHHGPHSTLESAWTAPISMSGHSLVAVPEEGCATARCATAAAPLPGSGTDTICEYVRLHPLNTWPPLRGQTVAADRLHVDAESAAHLPGYVFGVRMVARVFAVTCAMLAATLQG